MINRDDIEAGDKVFTRDGGCLVARMDKDGDVSLGFGFTWDWQKNGKYLRGRCHPLDIIRIEKAPKPVVEEVEIWVGVDANNNFDAYSKMPHDGLEYTSVVKLTIINGKLEKSEQVK